MPTRNIHFKGLRFTGDTNCGINWQAGFDNAGCPGDPNTDLCSGNKNCSRGRSLNFSGLNLLAGVPGIIAGVAGDKKAASKALQNAVNDVRRLYPGPGACPTGTEKLSSYQGNGQWTTLQCNSSCEYVTRAIREMQKAIDDYHAPRGETLYVQAYNAIIEEYKNYYNANCIVQAPPVLPKPDPAPEPKPSTTGSPGTGSTSGSTSAVTSGNGGTGSTQTLGATVGETAGAATTTKKKIPTWAWWVAGGLVAVTTIAVVVKKS